MATLVGLDIGTDGVRAVETTTTARSITVRKAHAIPLDPGVFTGGKVSDPAGLTAALRLLWKYGKFSTKKANLVVGSHPSVVVRGAAIAYLPKKDDRNVFVAETARHTMPVNSETLYLDHHVANVYTSPQVEGPDHTMADIALAGVDRESLDGILNCTIQAGLAPHSVDVTTFALARLVTASTSSSHSIDVLVHIGATTVTVTGILANQFAYQSAMNHFCGQDLTADIAEHFGVPVPEAEQLKVSFTQNQAERFDPFALDPQTIIAQWTTALVREIQSAITEMTQGIGHPVGRIWISGGGSGLPNLAARVSASQPAQVKVTVLDATTWVSNPQRLVSAHVQGQDLTAALAASVQ
ncbi:pilus assembly protein PilM [Jonesiaceae bacterium BS-20]|uniref:Pilus assembly protein PilM n=1 Tax=Jonesiaceae bacterium BS-20 TaxID=3120821 RepID=A0AAU7DYY0_9MICO